MDKEPLTCPQINFGHLTILIDLTILVTLIAPVGFFAKMLIAMTSLIFPMTVIKSASCNVITTLLAECIEED